MNNVQKIINEEIKSLIKNKNKDILIKECDHTRMYEMFYSELNEENNEAKRNEIIQLINNNEWEEQNPQSFKNSLTQSKHKEMLSDYDVSDLSKMKLFKLKDYNIGYALKNHNNTSYSEIVAMHNNESDVKNIGNIIMQSAIKNGGCYLDHFDSEKLSSIYSSLGFQEYARDKYDPMYDPDGKFKSKWGELDIIYRKLPNCR